MDGFDCVMAAAGRSDRMGEWKLLLPLGGDTIVERSVRNALAGCARVILVTGYRGEELARLFSGWESVLVVSNPDYRAGMFSSIRAGVRHVGTDRFFIALADMPLISPEIYRRLALLPTSGPSATRPFFRGKKGHPVLLPSVVIDKILHFDDSHTMQDALQGIPITRLEVDDQRVIRDIDTPEDYAGIAASL